jgi:nicotinate phosphoribosyltransferase
MSVLEKHAGLYTDHYELTMAQGYFLNNKKDTPACFDYFFRKNPFKGGYVIFAGLTDLLEVLEKLRFDDEDCKYLRSIGFAPEFVDYLNGFEFRADIYAPEEGEVVFPYEPVVRVEGNIIETQIVETMLLNLLNFESLIATKAARIRQAAGDRLVIDFVRRAHGLGGVLASKAAVIGGVDSTSNVYSAFMFGLTSAGTQAHSWIQSYDDEITAFRDYARAFPKKCVFLVDTYDTLKSGIPNAITVAREMESRGEKLFGVRLDSGDLAYLSKAARKMLDDAACTTLK